LCRCIVVLFFLNATSPTDIYTLSLHDALPIYLACDIDVVVKVGYCATIFAQRTVHHNAGKTQINRALADSRRLTVVLMHDDGNMRISLDRGLNQPFKKVLACIATCAS